MNNEEFGVRSGAGLITILGCAIIMSVRVSINLWLKHKSRWEELILSQIPTVFGISSWLIIFLGEDSAYIDLFPNFYKIFVILAFFRSFYKTICIEPPFLYGKFQHQMINISSVNLCGSTYNIKDCRSVNIFTKCVISFLCIYSCILITKIGLGISLLVKVSNYGEFNGDAWTLLRIIDIFFTFLLFYCFYGLKEAIKRVNLNIDTKFYLVSLSLMFFTSHCLISYLISFNIDPNSNTVIIYISNLFVVIESIIFSFYQTSFYSY